MSKFSLPALAALLAFSLALPGHAADAADSGDAQCRYVKTIDLPIRYVGRGLEPAVDGSINGKEATLLVDTGSYQSFLTMTGVVRRGMELHWGEARAVGIGGESRLYSAQISEIGIGPARSTRQFDLPVIGDTASAQEFDALLGATFLLRRDLMLDLRAKRLAFYMPHGCDRDQVRTADHLLWEENTIMVPFRHGAQDDGSADENPHFTVLVNGQRVDAEIDSGARDSFLTLAAAQRLGIDVHGPGAVRAGSSEGIGADRAQNWIVPVKSVQISNETVGNVQLRVVDEQGGIRTGLFLGQDFLRAHRVLFAMSQDRLYMAYLGGAIFAPGGRIEPWVRQEAEGGNADAQYALAVAYHAGNDPAQADAWLRKAAAGGQPHANLAIARSDMDNGRYADAIPRLRAALDRLPSEQLGALWLYAARVRTGQAALARSELEASARAQRSDDWPAPIARFYLGSLDAQRLLDAAGKDTARTCMARRYIADWHAARGEDAQAKAALAAGADCGTEGAAQR